MSGDIFYNIIEIYQLKNILSNISLYSYESPCLQMCGPPNIPLVRIAHDCETGLFI